MTQTQAIIENILNAVFDSTGVRVDSEPYSRRSREVVDARSMAAELMRRTGLSPSDSAKAMGLSPQSVRSLLGGFPDRMEYGGSLFRLLFGASERKMKGNQSELGK